MILQNKSMADQRQTTRDEDNSNLALKKVKRRKISCAPSVGGFGSRGGLSCALSCSIDSYGSVYKNLSPWIETIHDIIVCDFCL